MLTLTAAAALIPPADQSLSSATDYRLRLTTQQLLMALLFLESLHIILLTLRGRWARALWQ